MAANENALRVLAEGGWTRTMTRAIDDSAAAALPGADWTISGSQAAASLGEAVARSQPR